MNVEYLFTARHTRLCLRAAGHPRSQCLLWPSIKLRGPGIKHDVRVATSVIHTASHSCPNTPDGNRDRRQCAETNMKGLAQKMNRKIEKKGQT